MDKSTCKFSLGVKEGNNMRLFEIIMLVIVALWALPAMAQDVDPGYDGGSTVVDANTPDEEAFDDQIVPPGDTDPGTGGDGGTVGDGGGTTDPGDSDGDGGGKVKKPRKQNFGAIVSAEAHRLKATGGDKKGFGSWVKNHPAHPGKGGAGSGSASGNGGGSARKPGKKPK